MPGTTGKGKQVSSSPGPSPSVLPNVSNEPVLNKYRIYIPCYQFTDTAVPGTEDLERASTSALESDPFFLRDALKTSPQLAELRQRRKTGKQLERYYRRQNNV